MNQILDFEGKGKKRKEVLDENQYKNTQNISNSNYYNEYSYNENREYNQKGINSYNETYFDGLNLDFNRPNKKVIFLKYLTIFLIILTVLAFGFIVYTINKNDAETKKQNAIKDKISIEISEQNNKVSLKVVAKNAIDKIVYSWNGDTEKEQVINGDGRYEVNESSIDIPSGSNQITVTAVDNKGNRETASKSFERENGKDIEKPVININSTSGIISIEVKDNVELKDVKYQWSDSKAETLLPKADSKTVLKFELKPKEGDLTLTLTATDTAGNVMKKEENFKGVVKPKIDVKVNSDNSKILINVTHPVGLKSVEYSINGIEYSKKYTDVDTDSKDSTIVQELNFGNNTIRVKATSVEGYESKEFTGTTTRPLPTSNSITTPGGAVIQ